ncbi:bestrophin-2-like [Lutzomyia longipalpis]|uniref:bestrophin-2-like n=1 Tax=Lutzomyia longipalpis TaxID=7200 RepID=UPI002484394A|nr:bestrophin-2-like [Lutzomyia longipalpis]
MTITYTAEVATCRGFGCFLKLLLRWRGSIYKLVWLDLVTFLSIYYTFNIIYRFVLDEEQKNYFEGLVIYFNSYTNLIPLSFVLGFYVSMVMTRWWDQYLTIPLPFSISVLVSANIHGQDEGGRLMRRTIVRYVCLCITMVFINIAPRVKRRFPTLQQLVEAGLLTDNERAIIANMNERFPRTSKHWMPIVWAASIVTRARKEGRIRDDFAVKSMIDELNKVRLKCGNLGEYDTISIPLVYTQVVTIAVYSYCFATIMGSQWRDYDDEINGFSIPLNFPFFATLQFFFYMGWLKVAEVLINPFGEDDEDFEVNWMVDRNLQETYMIVNLMHDEHPELVKDQYWDEVFPSELPYTEETKEFREQPPKSSTADIEVQKTPSKTSVDNKTIDDNADKNQLGAHNESTTSDPDSVNLENIVTLALKRYFSREDSQSSKEEAPKTDLDEILTALTSSDRHPPTTSSADNNLNKSRSENKDDSTKEGCSKQEDTKMAEQNGDDEFEKLRLEREKERQERKKQQQITLESLNIPQGSMDVDALLEQLVTNITEQVNQRL